MGYLPDEEVHRGYGSYCYLGDHDTGIEGMAGREDVDT